MGQTWLFERDGRWYESRVSYYSRMHGLDITMGARDLTPRNIQEAAGRLLSKAGTTDCFRCHSTTPGATIIAGVQCEKCHGSAELHVRSKSAMRKLGKLTTKEMSDLCGQCHRSWSQVMANGPRGILNIRFQPYRLTLSKCYDAEDSRIRCTACHDPHGTLAPSVRFYDSKCLACHASGARTCRVAKSDCVICHMPRLELPGAHRDFADHRIRIVKANEQYPD